MDDSTPAGSTPAGSTPAGSTPAGSTLADVRPVAEGPRPTSWHRLLVGLLTVIVVAGAAGLFGVRSTEASASGGGWTVSVTYASVARAGLDVPWKVNVRREGGFTGPVTLAVTADYFDIYEEQGLDPAPASETADGERLYWTFDPPPAGTRPGNSGGPSGSVGGPGLLPASGDELAIDFDAYIQPSSQLGASGEVTVLDGGNEVVSVPFRTWLVP
jgi:hypothetical protein